MVFFSGFLPSLRVSYISFRSSYAQKWISIYVQLKLQLSAEAYLKVGFVALRKSMNAHSQQKCRIRFDCSNLEYA